MRPRRLTIVECLTSVAVMAILASLVLIPDSATSTRRSLERRARNWKASNVPTITDRSLIATDIALNGEWTTRRRFNHTAFTFVKRTDGRYDVQFSTGGCFGGCKLSRIGTLSEGVIVLDGAVAEYLPRTYDTLFAIRIESVDYLLPAESVQHFEEAIASGSEDWRWYVHTRGNESNEQILAQVHPNRTESIQSITSSVPLIRSFIEGKNESNTCLDRLLPSMFSVF